MYIKFGEIVLMDEKCTFVEKNYANTLRLASGPRSYD